MFSRTGVLILVECVVTGIRDEDMCGILEKERRM